MTSITIGPWKFRYIVGSHTVGIITPTRAKHTATIDTVRAGSTRVVGRTNGMPDERITPEEVAAYIVAQKLK